MPKTIKQLFAGAATLLLICAAGCASGKGSKELTARLLKAAELDVAYAQGLIAGYRNSALKDGKPEKEISCVSTKITPELVRPALLHVYSAEFTDDELRQALSFFETETGKAYVLYQREVAKALNAGAAVDELPEFFPPDANRVEAFAATRIGSAILTTDSPLRAPLRDKIKSQLFAVFDQCKNAQ